MNIENYDFENWNNEQIYFIINTCSKQEQTYILEKYIAWSLFNNKFNINIFRIYDNIKSNEYITNNRLIEIYENDTRYDIDILFFLPLLLLLNVVKNKI
jgi:hypothetical protein